MRKGRISFKPSPKVEEVLKYARAKKRKVVQVFGQVKQGKLEIDYKALAKFSKGYKKNISFIALNAPFKTKALTGSL